MKNIIRICCILVSAALVLISPFAQAKNASKYFAGDPLLLAKAIKAGKIEKIRTLSENIDLNQVHSNDMTLLAYSMLVKRVAAITELVIAGANPLQHTEGLGQPLVLAARGKAKYLKAFLEAGVDPNSRDRWGTPILFHALDSDNDDKVKLLIDYGVDLEIRSENVKRSALDHAFSGLNYDRVEYLIKQGLSNFHEEDVNGVTFGYMLQTELDHQSQDKSTLAYKKLIELKSLLLERGVKFPIAASDTLQRRLDKVGE